MTWFTISNLEDTPSPALLVYRDRIIKNIDEMIAVAGDPARLRPHVKTHKCREIVALQQEAGINKFKCATIAEAEMLAQCQVKDILLAFQPTGPNIQRLSKLAGEYPQSVISALVDNAFTAGQIGDFMKSADKRQDLFIDLDVGMHRTGIPAGSAALELKEFIKQHPHLKFRGWHAYDGHIRHSDFQQRKQLAEAGFEAVNQMISHDPNEEVVAGGTPTFPVHALNPRFNLSPGTCLLWDHGYSEQIPDLKFLEAAVLLTRVISKLDGNLLCLDLGHKAVASEMPHPRVYFPELAEVEFVGHSEEHLVVKTGAWDNYRVGDALYGIPMHICPTVALHQQLMVVEEGRVTDKWKVYARDRTITI